MASGPGRSGLGGGRWLALVLLASGTLTAAPAGRWLTLQQLNERDPAKGFAPVHLGERVIVQGVVNSKPHPFTDYQLLSIEDEAYGGIIRYGAKEKGFDGFQPGNEIKVSGVVVLQDGVGMVEPEEIGLVSRKLPPPPTDVTERELAGFRHLGRLVRTDARITGGGDSSNGSYINLDRPHRITAFLPRSLDHPPLITGLDVGTPVRVTGIAFQFCPQPPYDHHFQILVSSPSAIATTERNWVFRPSAVGAAVGGILLAILLLWHRERRSTSQRERLRKSYQLGEEILSASSTEIILERLSAALPGILGVSKVQLYVFNRAAKALDAVPREHEETVTISLSSPPGGPGSGAVACFHYRTLLVIPDVDRSPFPIGKASGPSPKSLLFAPMLAQGEMIGVLELDQEDRARDFNADEQELAQHFGNQLGVAIRLLDQRSVQEQLFRTEKMAAVGRLISGVVNELQAPLSSISDLAGRALERARGGPAERDVLALAAEARKASSMVARLVSFAAAEQAEARQVSIGALLHNLIEFREGDWKASGIRVHDLTTRESVTVLGSHGQLEQVFLNLLVHAEQALGESEQKLITIRTSLLAKRVLVEISFSAPAEWRKAGETASVLGLTRSVIGGHGGEVRLIEKPNTDPRFEVELPVAGRDRSVAAGQPLNGPKADPGRKWTALVIEPDEPAQRQMLALLSARGCRVVPVDNSDTGLDLAQRMRFDVVFCSVHAPGLNWVELSERMNLRVGGFVLIPDGYDPELSADFEDECRFVMPKPVQEADMDRILKAIEPVLPSVKHGAA